MDTTLPAFDKTQTLEALQALAETLGGAAHVDLRHEDGFSWVDLGSAAVEPKSVARVAQMIANASGFRFFFHSWRQGDLVGALDADFGSAGGVGVPYGPHSGIENYGDPYVPDLAQALAHRALMAERAAAREKVASGERARTLEDDQIAKALDGPAGQAFSEAVAKSMEGGFLTLDQIHRAAKAEHADAMPNIALDKIKQAAMRVRANCGANGEAMGRMVDRIIVPAHAPPAPSLADLAGQAARALMAATGLSKAETLDLLGRQLD